jgi:hypothetical protein
MSLFQDCEVNKTTAVLNTNIPIKLEFSKLVMENDKDHNYQFDAVFIPSLGQRKHLLQVIKSAISHSKNVLVLLSGKAPVWLEKYRSENPEKYKIEFVENLTSEYDATGFFRLNSSVNPSLQFLDNYDLPIKRNYAINLSRQRKYNLIGLIDDDMIFDQDHIKRSAFLLKQGAHMIGYHVLKYPDVSAIDHIERLITAKPSPVSIGGNFLFVNIDHINGLFPYIYNEDWFFIFQNLELKKDIKSAGIVGQLDHEPWKNTQRIQFEQFGEVVITGYKKLISMGRSLFNSSDLFWSDVYNEYLEKLNRLNGSTNNKVYNKALMFALHSTLTFNPSHIRHFLNSYQTDLEALS